jgi:hypothetical protein
MVWALGQHHTSQVVENSHLEDGWSDIREGGEVANHQIIGNGKAFPPMMYDVLSIHDIYIHVPLATSAGLDTVEGIFPKNGTCPRGWYTYPKLARYQRDEFLQTGLLMEMSNIGLPSYTRPLS